MLLKRTASTQKMFEIPIQQSCFTLEQSGKARRFKTSLSVMPAENKSRSVTIRLVFLLKKRPRCHFERRERLSDIHRHRSVRECLRPLVPTPKTKGCHPVKRV